MNELRDILQDDRAPKGARIDAIDTADKHLRKSLGEIDEKLEQRALVDPQGVLTTCTTLALLDPDCDEAYADVAKVFTSFEDARWPEPDANPDEPSAERAKRLLDQLEALTPGRLAEIAVHDLFSDPEIRVDLARRLGAEKIVEVRPASNFDDKRHHFDLTFTIQEKRKEARSVAVDVTVDVTLNTKDQRKLLRQLEFGVPIASDVTATRLLPFTILPIDGDLCHAYLMRRIQQVVALDELPASRNYELAHHALEARTHRKQFFQPLDRFLANAATFLREALDRDPTMPLSASYPVTRAVINGIVQRG